MYHKKNIPANLYFAAFERGGGAVLCGAVGVSGKSGRTYFLAKMPETGNRVGVSEYELDVVDTGKHARPIVFSRSQKGAIDALKNFCSAERKDADAVLDNLESVNISESAA